MSTMEVEVANGKYIVKRPGGRIGAMSMVLMTKMSSIDGLRTVPNSDPEKGPVEDPALIEKVKAMNAVLIQAQMEKVFQEWSEKILPHLVVSGPFTYEDMPGEDQLALFLAVTGEMKLSEGFFRIVPPASS